MVGGSNPGGCEIFRTRPDRPWSPPSLLYNGYLVFPGCKQLPGRDADPSPPSSAVGHERVELYLYSPYGSYGQYRASVPVQGCTLPLYGISICTFFRFEHFMNVSRMCLIAYESGPWNIIQIRLISKLPFRSRMRNCKLFGSWLRSPAASLTLQLNPLKPELNSICYLLALLGAHYFLHVSRIRVNVRHPWFIKRYILTIIVNILCTSDSSFRKRRRFKNGEW